jgi:5'-AMP-activated protein kinase catalytic alpha subunit
MRAEHHRALFERNQFFDKMDAYSKGEAARPAAANLDELQARLRELQQQRQLLKRPELRGVGPEPPRPGSRPRPRSAHPTVTATNGAVHPLRPVRRPSGAAPAADVPHSPATAAAHALEQHHREERRHSGSDARPASARPGSAHNYDHDRDAHVGGVQPHMQPGRPRSSRLQRGSFGPACAPPLFSMHSTPRFDEHRSAAETERAAGRTALLRRLIREGYARLGLPAPTIAPGMALEPLLYRQEKVLGKGAFGLVSLARSVVTGELVAMKTVDKSKLTNENLRKTVEHEIRILKKLKHKRIVRLYEVIDTPRSIILILEYVDGGTVQQLVKKHKRLEEADAARILFQLVDAVDYCHTHHVCHRDLKLENFMLARGGRSLKLIDFGLSVVWKVGQALFKSYGTPCYMAPEIIKGASYQGHHVDIWSLGVALATMLTGALPFQGAGDTELKKRILRGSFACPEHVSAEARDLLHKMLALNPEARLSLADIKRHPWLAPYADGRASGGGASPHGARPTGVAAPADEPLDAGVVARLAEAGLPPDEVERAVRTNSYSHEAACYEMALAARASEQSARNSERHAERELTAGFQAFNLQ